LRCGNAREAVKTKGTRTFIAKETHRRTVALAMKVRVPFVLVGPLGFEPRTKGFA